MGAWSRAADPDGQLRSVAGPVSPPHWLASPQLSSSKSGFLEPVGLRHHPFCLTGWAARTGVPCSQGLGSWLMLRDSSPGPGRGWEDPLQTLQEPILPPALPAGSECLPWGSSPGRPWNGSAAPGPMLALRACGSL